MSPEDTNCPIDFDPCIRDNTSCADFAQPKSHLSANEAARQVIDLRPAELIATPNEEFANALLNRGCTLQRHAFGMTLNLLANQRKQTNGPQHTYASQFIENFSAHELFDSWHCAYPPGHPDFLPGTKENLISENIQPLLDRSLLGPNHKCSQALTNDGDVIAAIIVSLREGEAPFGGPWVSELWCDPRFQHQGIGRTLLTTAITSLTEDGYTSLGLAVSYGNPAKKLYESLGFTVVSESWTIKLPIA